MNIMELLDRDLTMETIRQIVQVKSDRKLEIQLPETVEPGLVEVVVVLQSVKQTTDAKEQSRQKALSALKELANLRKDLPPVDVVEIVRASREELEQRGQF